MHITLDFNSSLKKILPTQNTSDLASKIILSPPAGSVTARSKKVVLLLIHCILLL